MKYTETKSKAIPARKTKVTRKTGATKARGSRYSCISFDPKEIGIDDRCSDYDGLYDRCWEYDDSYDQCDCSGNYGGDPASQGE